MRGAVVVVAVTLLCVVAGCSAVPAGDRSTTAVTSADVPADRPADYPFPPGVDANGSVHPDALAGAHRAAVTNRSHTVVYRVNVTTAVDGEVVSTSNWTRTVAYGNATVYRSEITYDAVGYRNASGGTSVYANGTVEVVRTTRGAEVGYATETLAERPPALGQVLSALERFVPPRNASAERVIRDGQPNTVVRAREFAERNHLVHDERAAARIRPSGLVESLTVGYTENETYTSRVSDVTVTVDYSAVGETTVTPPDWLPAAREALERADEPVATNATTTASG